MVKQITEESFEAEIKTGLTLVDFFTTWCGPCRMLAPELEKLAQELDGQTKIVKIDAEQAQGVSLNLQVTAFPTLILFHDGREIGRLLGLRKAADIKQFIQNAAGDARLLLW